MSANNTSRLLTVQDVASRLGVPVSWVYTQSEAGSLPSFKLGRYVRFDPEAIEDYLQAQRRGTNA
jgi:excisionase family DNA binding protein